MPTKKLIQIAKILSAIFSPLYASLWALFGLFAFSYLKVMPWGYKIFIVLLVYLLCVFTPHMGINLFRTFKKWTHWQLSHREHRHMPYIVTLISYTACLVIMTRMNVIMSIRSIVMTALISQIICVTINAWWKISTHMVGMGGLAGALIAFSFQYDFNPVLLLCILILLSGLLGTSRIILRQHSLAQVLIGFAVGFACAMTFILVCWM